MEPRRDDLKTDLDAAVQTRKELGAEYESEIVDSFLARLDARLEAQVERRVAERITEYARPPQQRAQHQQGGRSFGPKLSIISMALGIPLSGIGGGTAGVTGLMVVWAGIVGVNIAATFGELRERRLEREAQSRRRDGWD
ncbi:hypothetical protein ACIQGZ_14605 [Streptomyces sp. NPDC092296]|uniref:hypothetical protein n=1 Tax=Streptomyces sp. NPDC092296 TaxID=3366012 RepID=UPI0038125CDA